MQDAIVSFKDGEITGRTLIGKPIPQSDRFKANG